MSTKAISRRLFSKVVAGSLLTGGSVLEAAVQETRQTGSLSDGTASGQFVGFICDMPAGMPAYDRVSFTARAEHPMRISVQLRAENLERPRS